MRDIIDRLSHYEQISDDPIIFRDAKAEINKLREELEEAKEPCESPCSRGFELISENKGLRDRLKISIEYVDGIPTGYGEDEIDRQQAEIERLKAQIEHMSVAIVNSDSMQLAWERIQEIERLRTDNNVLDAEAAKAINGLRDANLEIEQLRVECLVQSNCIESYHTEIEQLREEQIIKNTTIANLHSEIEKMQKEIKKLRIQITDDLSTAYDQQAEIKKLKEDNRTVIGALENMHMTESETVEELRNEIEQLNKEHMEETATYEIELYDLKTENQKLLGDRLLGKSRLMQKEFKELREENEWLKEQLEIRGKEWKATKGLKELLSEDNEGSCKSCDKLADKIIELDADKLRLESELELADEELNKLRQDIKNAEAWRANIGGKRIHELESEVRQLHSTIQGWLTANAPGGWIDHLRIENKHLRNLAKDFYSDRYINEVLRNGLEKRGTT